MEIVDLAALTPEIRAELIGDERDPYEEERNPGLQWRAKTNHVVLRADDGAYVACAGLLLTDVQAGETPLAVVGIGGVIVNQAHRGHGHARTVLEAALRRAQTMGPAFALLFCLPDRAGLYERFGFAALEDPVTAAQPDGPVTVPLVAMWRSLAGDTTWPPGPVTLSDLPF